MAIFLKATGRVPWRGPDGLPPRQALRSLRTRCIRAGSRQAEHLPDRQAPGSRDPVQNAVIERQPHLQSPCWIEHAVVELGRQQRHQVRNAGALRAEGGNTEGAKETAAERAADVESGPPQQSPEGPRDAAQADGPAVGRDVPRRFVLMVVDDRVDFPEGAVFRAADVGIEDDAFVLELAIDIKCCDVGGVFVEPRPGEGQIRSAQHRGASSHQGVRLGENGRPGRWGCTLLPGRDEAGQVHAPFDGHAGDPGAEMHQVGDQAPKITDRDVSAAYSRHSYPLYQ